MKALAWFREQANRLKLVSALGVAAAAILAVNANLWAARHTTRWDFTSDGLYTLSEPTKRTLRALTEPVEIIVLLSRTDPLNAGVRYLLTAYRAETSKLVVRFVDPEQNPAEFSSIQKKYGILAGRADDGRPITDASLIIARGSQHWFVSPDEMLRFDVETARARPRLEQALTEGIVNVLETEKALVCFSSGHEESGFDDPGPEGLIELKNRLEKSNYSAEERDFSGRSEPLGGCRLLIVAGPRLAFGRSDAQKIVKAIQEGMSALLLLGPLLGEDGAIVSSGLEPVVDLAQATLERNLIVETSPELRLPRGLGEVFFAEPSAHPVTVGLMPTGGKRGLRVLISQAQGVRPVSDQSQPLLSSSEQTIGLRDFRPLLEGTLENALRDAPRARQVLAVARQVGTARTARSARILVSGTGILAGNRAFRDAGLYGTRLFVENAVSWLAARPALVSVPEKPEVEIGLALTEESLGEVLRYVVITMPLSAALLGVFVVWRRRWAEKRSRRPASQEKDEARA